MKIQRMFLDYLEYSRVYKIKPTYEYERTLVRSLLRCFGHIKVTDTKHLKKEKVNEIIVYYRQETNCKAISINHHIGLLKRIFKYFKIQNTWIEEMPKLKVSKRHFPIFTENQLKQIFQYVNQLNYSSNSYSYRAIIYLLLDTGCRINELLNIKISNIDYDERHILLQVTKNKRERFVLFTHLSAPIIRNLMKLNHGKSEYLFYNHIRGREINYNDVKLFLRRMQDVIGIEKLHAHMFRRTFATKLHENGASLASIQILLGHETLEMTRNYIDVSISKIKKDYDTFGIFKDNI